MRLVTELTRDNNTHPDDSDPLCLEVTLIHGRAEDRSWGAVHLEFEHSAILRNPITEQTARVQLYAFHAYPHGDHLAMWCKIRPDARSSHDWLAPYASCVALVRPFPNEDDPRAWHGIVLGGQADF